MNNHRISKPADLGSFDADGASFGVEGTYFAILDDDLSTVLDHGLSTGATVHTFNEDGDPISFAVDADACDGLVSLLESVGRQLRAAETAEAERVHADDEGGAT